MGPINISKKDHALIIGAGPIGLLHLLLLKKTWATVTVIDRHAKKLRTAKKLGADFTGKGEGIFDYAFECTGRPEVWEASVNHVRRGGTVILFGGCKSGTAVTYDAGRLHYDEITLKGVFHFTPEDVKKAYRLLCGGGIDVSQLISGRYPLSRIQKAFEKLTRGEGIKYAIIP
jgi:L-iditol 2-dehydrogenase